MSTTPTPTTKKKKKKDPGVYTLEDAKKDFRVFLLAIWVHLGLPAPTPIQYDIARFIQLGPKRMIVMAFRGVGKSWITSAFVCWLLLNNPQLKILVVSASKERADAFSIFTKRLINEVPMLQHLRAGENQRDSNIAFDVGPATAAHAPSVKSIGITGQLTGSRADVIVADDVEVPKNSATQIQRDKLSGLVKEFDAVLSPGGRIVYLGTPQTEMSLYNSLAQRGYVARIWPARIPGPKLVEGYNGALSPYILKQIEKGRKVGEPTDPTRFNSMDLMEREASYGRSGFALQFMLDTTLSDAERYPLKLSDFIVFNTHVDIHPQKIVWASKPELAINDLQPVGLAGDRYYSPMHVSEERWVEYQGAVLAVDPSGRGKDETSYAVVKAGLGMLWLTDAGGISGGYEDGALKELIAVARKNKVKNILVESNFGDGMFTRLLQAALQKHKYLCGVEEVRHSKQKELRIIDTLEPVLNTHRLVVDPAVIHNDLKADLRYQLFYQLTRITRERGALAHDDRVDALAMAVAYWLDVLGRDVDAAVDSAHEEALMKELDRFLLHCTGSPMRNLNKWVPLRA
jgi:hypothetical protein